MIEEISNFVENISEEYFTENVEPSDGIHIWLPLDNNGNFIKDHYKSYLVKTVSKETKYYQLNNDNLEEVNVDLDLGLREQYSSYLSLNKAPDFRRKLHSTSPFILWFKKKNIDEIQDSFYDYFDNLKKYFDKNTQNQIDIIKKFCKENLVNLVNKEELLNKIKSDYYIKVYFNAELDLIRKGHRNYLKGKLFNKDAYNTKDGKFGLSDFLNGDNVKKLFLMHKTSRFKINNRISRDDAYNLYLFEKLLRNKPKSKLPNPLPIFIEKDELNQKVVELYNRQRILNFHEIINRLLQEHNNDISNYYLINWSKKGGLTINDVDFVSNFKYWLDDFNVHDIFQINNAQQLKIENIYDFETEILYKLFNNILIQKTSVGEVNYRYFDDLEYKSSYMTRTAYHNTLKYRKSFYDFIYKSRTNTISNYIFYNLAISSIMDDILHDEYRDNLHSKERSIKEKLNIFFSLNIKFGGDEMASKIPILRERLEEMLNDQDTHIETDEEFAFNAGQLIYYLIYQSETSNKTHALLEPYISKNDPKLFKLAITRGIEKYKHNFPFGTKKFPKLTSEILGYDCNKKIKEMLPILLAGYFSNSILFDK